MQGILVELEGLIRDGKEGDKLPTIRELVKRYNCNQAEVQAALLDLKHRDLIQSHVGRGTFIKHSRSGSNNARSETKSRILLMQKQAVMARGVQAMARISELFEASGFECIQLVYRNLDELTSLVRQMPGFDGFVLSTRFSNVPAQLLGYLQSNSKAVVLDGHAVGGLDIDCVGTKWREAIDVAVAKLCNLGHSRISLLAPRMELRPMLEAKDHFISLGRWGVVGEAGKNVALFDHSDASEEHISENLNTCGVVASGPATAVIVMGLFDGRTLLSALRKNGLTPGKDISVVVLGSNDVFFEHLDLFDTVGGSAEDASQLVFDLVRARLEGREIDSRLHFLEVSGIDRGSCCEAQMIEERTV